MGGGTGGSLGKSEFGRARQLTASTALPAHAGSATANLAVAPAGGRERGATLSRAGSHKKEKKVALTLGARLRAGIGEVSSGKAAPTGLMGRLRQTTVHYVRCVKPNDSMAAFGFEQQRVLVQLQCSGVLEMVRIRRQVHRHETALEPLSLAPPYNRSITAVPPAVGLPFAHSLPRVRAEILAAAPSRRGAQPHRRTACRRRLGRRR